MNLGFCQETEDLLFLLKGKVVDIETSMPILNASIRIIGTDTSTVEIKTDSIGLFNTLIEKNTSYSVTVSKPSYLKAKGKETTITETESKVFAHFYELQPIVSVQHGFTSVNLDSTVTFKTFDISKDSIILHKINPFINTKDIASRIDENSENQYSIINSKNKYIDSFYIEFLERDVLRITSNGINEIFYIIGYKTNLTQRYLLLKKED
jgi:hypothetical protein